MKMGKLSELGSFKNGLNFSKETAQGKGCMILGVGDFAGKTYIPTEGLEEIDASFVKEDDLIQNDDIIFVRSNGNKALVGRILFAKGIKRDICFSGFCIRFRPNKKVIDPTYLFYILKSEYCKRQYAPSQQTNITNLSQDTLGAVFVPIFDCLEDEKKAVRLLYDLDAKIDLNNRICAELESMARTLYEYWFVQFDFPDENGRPYKSSGGAMEWSAVLKRNIPKGWKSGTLSDIANITMGQSPDGASYNEDGDGVIFFQGSTDFGQRFPTERVYTTAPTRFAKKGDILMSVRAPVGAVNIALDDCCIGRGLSALNSKIGSQLYLLYVVSKFKHMFEIMNGNGTTFGSVNKDELYALNIVIPDYKILELFENAVSTIEQKIRRCELENRELTRLRDDLLPILMNGQATVTGYY